MRKYFILAITLLILCIPISKLSAQCSCAFETFYQNTSNLPALTQTVSFIRAGKNVTTGTIGNVIVESTDQVVFESLNIELEDGFEVENGGGFEANVVRACGLSISTITGVDFSLTPVTPSGDYTVSVSSVSGGSGNVSVLWRNGNTELGTGLSFAANVDSLSTIPNVAIITDICTGDVIIRDVPVPSEAFSILSANGISFVAAEPSQIVAQPQTWINPGVASKVARSKDLLEEQQISSTEAVFKTYPNPNPGVFQVNLGRVQADTKPTHIVVYNSFGKEVLTQGCTQLREVEINLLNQPSGVFFIKVFSGDKELYAERVMYQD